MQNYGFVLFSQFFKYSCFCQCSTSTANLKALAILLADSKSPMFSSMIIKASAVETKPGLGGLRRGA